MDRISVEKLLEKYGRIYYSGNDDRLNELEFVRQHTVLLSSEYELYRLAIISAAKGIDKETISYSKKGIEQSIIAGNDYLTAEFYIFLGLHYRMKNQCEDAFRAYIAALRIIPSARCYNNIADLYMFIGALEEAQEFLTKALELLDAKVEKTKFETRLLNIVYTNISEVEFLQGNFKLAKNSALSILEISIDQGDIFGQGYGLAVLGNICMEKEDYESAMHYLDKAEALYNGCDKVAQRQIESEINNVIILQARTLYKNRAYQLSIDKLELILIKDSDYFDQLIKNYEALDDKDMAYKTYKAYMTFIKLEKEHHIFEQKQNFKTTVDIYKTEMKAHEYELLYSNTKSIGEIGRQIIAVDRLDDVLDTIYNHINKIMKFDSLTLGVLEGEVLFFKWIIEENSYQEPFKVNIDNKNSISAWVARNKKSIRLNDALTKEELLKYKEKPDMNWHGNEMDSLIITPIMVKNEVLGVITVQSSEKFIYSEYDLEVINTLASFIGVAMKNWQSKEALLVMNEKLEELSKTDALTGVSNRHVLSEIVEELFRRDTDKDYKISVVMIDIDHFKEYNDTYGHIDGDRCLIEIVNELQKELDKGKNRLFRYGGDEFAAIVPYMQAKDLHRLLEKIRTNIEALHLANKNSGVSDFVTCSFGFTTITKGDKDYQKAFYMADEALYKSKANGKNRISFIKD